MKESLIFIGLGETGENITPVSPYNIPAYHITSSVDFKEWLQAKLLPIYKECKVKKVSTIRYIFITAAYEDTNITLKTFIETLIEIHKNILIIPIELEAFILLPSIEADQKSKAKCYQFFMELNNLDSRKCPILFWLLDTDRIPFEYLKEVINIYLSTDRYRTFNDENRLRLTRGGKFLYGSVGIGKLCFPATKWQENLGLMLAYDLLNVKALSPLEVVSDAIKIQISQIHSLLKKRLTDIANFIAEPITLSRENLLPANLAIEEDDSIEKFLCKLKLSIEQKKAKRYEKILHLTEAFYRDVKKELDDILNTASHAPYSAWGFIGLLLDSGGPYLEFLKKESPDRAETRHLVSIENFLLGWQGEDTSPILRCLFNELLNMQKEFYKVHKLPFQEFSSWEALQNEISFLLKQPGMDKVFEADKEYIRALQYITSFIVKALAEPYTHPFTSDSFQEVVDLFETRLSVILEGVMNQARSVLKKIQDLDSKISKLRWRKYNPRFWSLFSKKRTLEKELQKLKRHLETTCVKVFEEYQRLFPFFFAPFVARKLQELIRPLEREIRVFISELEDTRHLLREQINKTYLSAVPFEISIVENHEDIEKLYHYKLNQSNLTKLLEKFFENTLEGKNLSIGLSAFYTPEDRRKLFFTEIQDYAKSRFSWIREWNVAKAISFLKKQKSMAQRLELASYPLLKVNESIEPASRRSALFVGFGPKTHNTFTALCFPNKDPIFFNHDDQETITGLRLYHGFTISLIEGWNHWEEEGQKFPQY